MAHIAAVHPLVVYVSIPPPPTPPPPTPPPPSTQAQHLTSAGLWQRALPPGQYSRQPLRTRLCLTLAAFSWFYLPVLNAWFHGPTPTPFLIHQIWGLSFLSLVSDFPLWTLTSLAGGFCEHFVLARRGTCRHLESVWNTLLRYLDIVLQGTGAFEGAGWTEEWPQTATPLVSDVSDGCSNCA